MAVPNARLLRVAQIRLRAGDARGDRSRPVSRRAARPDGCRGIGRLTPWIRSDRLQNDTRLTPGAQMRTVIRRGAALLVAASVAAAVADPGCADPAAPPDMGRPSELAYQLSPPPVTRGLIPNYLPEIPPSDRTTDAPRPQRAQHAAQPHGAAKSAGSGAKRTVHRSRRCRRSAGRPVRRARHQANGRLACGARRAAEVTSLQKEERAGSGQAAVSRSSW